MRKLLTMMLLAAGLAAGAQATDHPDNFKKQISRTPHLIWEWADKDSTRAFQDTIEGVVKLYFQDNEPGLRMEYFSYYYDLEELYDGKTTRSLIKDWLSLDLDTMYYHDVLVEYNEYSGDSFRADVRYNYGVMWNEPYLQDSLIVTMEQASLTMDTLSDGEILLNLSYLKLMEDSAEFKHLLLDNANDQGIKEE